MSNEHAALHDLEAIRTLKYRYAEAVDQHIAQRSASSLAAITELFTADARADYGQFGVYEGDGVATFFRDVLPGIASWTRHFMFNPILEIEGTRGQGRWYATAHAVFVANPGAGVQVLYVRYEDVYAKTPSGWRLAAITAHFDTPA